jgi:hypothetical protein
VIDNVLATSSKVEIKPLLIRQMKIFKQHPKILRAMTNLFFQVATKKFRSFDLATENLVA